MIAPAMQLRGQEAAAASSHEFNASAQWAWEANPDGCAVRVRLAQFPSLVGLSRQLRKQSQSVLARQLMQDTLAALPGAGAGATCAIHHDALGAPHLAAASPAADVQQAPSISIAHGGSFVACAAAASPDGQQVRVGVDVELLQGRDWNALLPLMLHATEAERLAGMPPADRDREALRLWCCKEAVLKATGRGVQTIGDLALVQVAAHDELLAAPGFAGDVSSWQLQSHVPVPGVAVAFAWKTA